MPFQKFNTANNAICLLSLPVSDTDLTLIATGNYGRFPTANFIIKVTQYDTDGVTVLARENMLVTSRTGASFFIGTRAYEAVPISDAASTNIQQALPFTANSVIECVVSLGFLDDIQDEVARLETDKLDVAAFQNGTKVYAATSTGTDAYAITLSPAITAYQNGQVFRVLTDVGNTGPATLNVNGLGAITIKKLHDQDLATGDIEAGQIVTVTYVSGTFQMDSQIATLPTVDITTLTEKTSPLGDDFALVYSTSDTANRKEQIGNIGRISNFVSGGTITAGQVCKLTNAPIRASIGDMILGIATNSVTVGQTVGVMTSGVINGLSGLTAGTEYYAGATGAITATINSSPIGIAISTTQLLIRIPPRKAIVTLTKSLTEATTTTTYGHSLGCVPKSIRITAVSDQNSTGWSGTTSGLWDGTNQSCTTSGGVYASNAIVIQTAAGTYQAGIVQAVTSTNFQIAWTKTAAPTGTAYCICELSS